MDVRLYKVVNEVQPLNYPSTNSAGFTGKKKTTNVNRNVTYYTQIMVLLNGNDKLRKSGKRNTFAFTLRQAFKGKITQINLPKVSHWETQEPHSPELGPTLSKQSHEGMVLPLGVSQFRFQCCVSPPMKTIM